MVPSAILATVRQKYEALAPLLHEKAQRRWAACEARALGRGGISLVAAATGLPPPTIHRGRAELHSGPPPPPAWPPHACPPAIAVCSRIFPPSSTPPRVAIRCRLCSGRARAHA